ncbi:MAG: hypothetical protein WCO00_17415 [Rhodospirillaceae bacterium]
MAGQAINSHLCQLALKAGGELYRFEALFGEDLDEVVIASLDRLVLRKALQDILLLVRRKRLNTIVVPVHFATLASSRTRQDYLGVVVRRSAAMPAPVTIGLSFGLAKPDPAVRGLVEC